MKKKNYKLVKGVIALGLVVVVMTTSFSACKTTNFKDLENVSPEDKISLVDEDGNKLIVLAEKSKKDKYYEPVEMYGYVRVNDGKTEFYDVLEKRTIDLDACSKRFDYKFCDFTEILLDRDYSDVVTNKYVDMNNLEIIAYSAYVKHDGSAIGIPFLKDETNNSPNDLYDFELGVAYTDDSEEKETELAKTKN